MPDIKKFRFLLNFKNIFLFISLILILGTALYFLNIKNRLSSKQTQAIYENLPDENGNSRIIKRQYPSDISLPSFIIKGWYKVPDELKTNYDLQETVSVRVISTGKITNDVLTSPTSGKKLANVMQLEVKIDDTQEYLNNNQPFNIVLRALQDPGQGSIEPIPSLILKALQQMSLKNLRDQYKLGDMSIDELNNEVTQSNSELADKYFEDRYTEKEVSELFKEGTIWIVTPYLKANHVSKEFEKEVSQPLYSLEFLNEYYNGGDSKFMEAVFSKNTSILKQPVIVLNLYAQQ